MTERQVWQAFVDELTARGDGQRLRRHVPLAPFTSYGIGGPADLLLVAEDLDELVAWVALARRCEVPLLLLGGGTNVLVADAGVRGLVIVNACAQSSLTSDGLLTAQAGVLLWDLARGSVEQGWAGLEWAVGVPGTLGGAVVGNAGAYGGSMADVLRWVRLLLPDGETRLVSADELDYGYRSSAIKAEPDRARRAVVLEAGLQLTPGDGEALRERARDYEARRQANTPRGQSCGSVFKRTLQYPAGFLIDQAGLKGSRVGAAEVSTLHANFILNTGGATAWDVRQLIEIVQKRVWAAFGQRLAPEIEFVGEWASTVPQPGEDETR